MNEERLAEIEGAKMPLVTSGTQVPSAAMENSLRKEWQGYRDELAAEVRRLQVIEVRVRAFMKANQQAHKVRIDASAYLIATEKELASILGDE